MVFTMGTGENLNWVVQVFGLVQRYVVLFAGGYVVYGWVMQASRLEISPRERKTNAKFKRKGREVLDIGIGREIVTTRKRVMN